jgi:hypothetical protein
MTSEDFIMRYVSFSLLGLISFTLLGLTATGCVDSSKTSQTEIPPQSSTNTNQSAEPVEPSSPKVDDGTVSFDRSVIPVGTKYRSITSTEITIGSGVSPTKMTSTENKELTSATNGEFIWKKTTTQKIDSMGSQSLREGKALEDNRIVFTKEDKYGNFISSEGEKSDAYHTYDSKPKYPIRVHDTWEGYTIKSDKNKYQDKYTLEALAEINGKKFAIISVESKEEGNGHSSTKCWIEVPSGIIYKFEGTVETVNLQNRPGYLKATGYLVDESEKPLIP